MAGLKDESILRQRGQGHIYNAACAAALASAEAKDVEASRRYRGWALAWLKEEVAPLRAALAQVVNALEASPSLSPQRLALVERKRQILNAVAHGKTRDPDLASLRSHPEFAAIYKEL